MKSARKLLSDDKPYNPLQKKNLAESIVRAILEQTSRPMLQTDDLGGAGVYIIYYVGNSPLYAPVASKNAKGQFAQPIYGSEREFDGAPILRGFPDLLKFDEMGIGDCHAFGLQQ